mmetsp:Transcript_44555/g.105596  ORF Transcript_44555/g.105596 Transcript_44555/m.105596 type:complete len:374 (+) Transcript_44555:273-1394(+)
MTLRRSAVRHCTCWRPRVEHRRDQQTSADVYDVSNIGRLECGPGGAGGACTTSMLVCLEKTPAPPMIDLLVEMRKVLREKRYSQIPQLSGSKDVDLKTPFRVRNERGGGRTRALFIGINYVGQSGELRGCHNDVAAMKQYIATQGYAQEEMKVLMDDGRSERPTLANILAGFRWLVRGAREGDSLFFHYSGHGAQLPDDNGDEADGYDETLVPVDYKTAGQIRDDTIFQELVAVLPKGCKLTAVMDCCHSGTIMDLPYIFTADNDGISQYESGHVSHLQQNPEFNWSKAAMVGFQLFQMYNSGASKVQIASRGVTLLSEAGFDWVKLAQVLITALLMLLAGRSFPDIIHAAKNIITAPPKRPAQPLKVPGKTQ